MRQNLQMSCWLISLFCTGILLSACRVSVETLTIPPIETKAIITPSLTATPLTKTSVPITPTAELILPLTVTPAPMLSDLEKAREALITFFSLLHAGRYDEAVYYYGGDYNSLRDWNPTIAEDDYATLLRYGCGAGLQCLRIKTIISEEQASTTEFKFTVEFIKDDGTTFVLGPCCGATEDEMPPQSQFTFTVKKVNSKFLVQELPVYVP
jgi:hypothetical protein